MIKKGEEQNGFQKGRSCCDGYFPLKIIIEKHKNSILKPIWHS
jgi:hypothetical protein